ncbi:hypothetical protein EJ04DRAFT_444883 [Polyplosphaeria fusca]|uniref:DUF8021 domain-containing protein n=1 Tax=Polyplosphaeria fusca TaxID=682080 RepID=A0A9P4QNA0_9PLEO|nr:hypothetical protein EJ04DRAFT_444883 [Polyplosphaeria fusca]
MKSLGLVALAGLASQASAACTRAMLEEATSAYIKAQAAGDTKLLSLASNVSYLENDVSMPVSKSILSQPITIDFNRSLHDTTQCATFTELSAATNKIPMVINARMLFTDDKVTTIQTLVADAGDWVFNATAQLKWTKQESWPTIPSAKQDSRAVIQAAGDAYLTSWTKANVSVPYGTPCARLEGGMYTGDRSPTTNTCTMPLFPEPFTIGNRRYVIDEEVGGLSIFNDFPFIDKTKPNGTASGNFFRVEGGKIRYIHETTICVAKNCGR